MIFLTVSKQKLKLRDRRNLKMHDNIQVFNYLQDMLIEYSSKDKVIIAIEEH